LKRAVEAAASVATTPVSPATPVCTLLLLALTAGFAAGLISFLSRSFVFLASTVNSI